MHRSNRKADRQSIPEPRAQGIGSDPKIPPSVAEFTPDEIQKFTIGHGHYNEDECKVRDLTTAQLKKIIENFKRFSKVASTDELYGVGIEVKSVHKRNDYVRFYSGLEEDVELKEFDIGQGRVFFFIDTRHRVLEVVAYVNSHPEYKKNRR